MGKLTINTTRKELFGSLDALDEDDNIFKDYFIDTNVFYKMSSDERFYILVGEKGTGKSAVMKMCMIKDKAEGKMIVDIHRPQVDEKLDINSKVNEWRNYLSEQILCSMHKELQGDSTGVTGIIHAVEDVFNDYVKGKFHINYKEFKLKILDNIGSDIVTVYIDDLDNGYRGTDAQNESIISLFTAIREMIRGNKNLRFRVTLRTDVYDNVRCVDEASDKIQDARVDLLITNHLILAMLTKRVMKYLGDGGDRLDYKTLKQNEMIAMMKELFLPVFHGRGRWKDRPVNNVLMALTRRRPRDLFVLCGLAWDHAVGNNRTCISSEDLQAVFNDYSNERLKDAIAEYHHEFSGKNDLRELILALKPSERQKKECSCLHLYSKNSLKNKIRTITERRNFRWNSGHIATDIDLMRFLYKANIIVGRIDEKNNIRRIYYMEKPNLISDLVDFKYLLEVHPAYRWAIDTMDENIIQTIEYESE